MPYFLTSICAKRDSIENPTLQVATHRTFGFYKSLYLACDSVNDNYGNMQEGLYNYLVIEKMYEGIHPPVTEEFWYAWQDSKWTACPKPDFAVGVSNWALG